LLEYPNTFDDAEYQQLVARFDKVAKWNDTKFLLY
jgi:hypothetical protein